jgi:hypothetical protein
MTPIGAAVDDMTEVATTVAAVAAFEADVWKWRHRAEAFEADFRKWRHRATIAELALRRVNACVTYNCYDATVARIVRTALDADREET